MESSVKWSAIRLPSIPGFCGSSLRRGSCRLSPWSLDTVQHCVHSCAEIYVSHSKKPLKSSSLLASSQALCAWEIKCLRANSQFITDLTEQKPSLVWEHPLPNGCVRASLFIALFIYSKFLISLGLHFAVMLQHLWAEAFSMQSSIWLCCKCSPGQYAGLTNLTVPTYKSFRGTYVNTNCIDRELFMCFPKENI